MNYLGYMFWHTQVLTAIKEEKKEKEIEEMLYDRETMTVPA